MQKLPAILAVKHALNAVLQFRIAGMRIGLPWILALTGINILDLLYFSKADPMVEDQSQIMVFPPAHIIIAALSLIVFSSIAVNWHRYILLDEITVSEKIFRLDRPVWEYAGRTFLIMLIAFMPTYLISAILFKTMPTFSLLLAIPFVVAGVFIMRMSVALPAIALYRKDIGIIAALRITQGNNWQFAGLLALNAMIVFATLLVLMVVVAVIAGASPTAARILAVALSVPAKLFLSLFSVSLLSSLYGFFVEKRKF